TNRAAISDSRRLELAEKFYTAAVTLWPILERNFARAAHPLTGNALEAAKVALTLSAEHDPRADQQLYVVRAGAGENLARCACDLCPFPFAGPAPDAYLQR